MNVLLNILNIASPLLLITMGALVSEYAGRMALFLDGIINLGAFLCYLFVVLTGNVWAGCTLSVLSCMLLVFLLERISSTLKANLFLSSLAMNLLFTSTVSLISAAVFNTRGVLYSADFKFVSSVMKGWTSLFCYGFSILLILILKFTVPGLKLRICGSDSDVLEAEGISSSKYKCISWLITAFTGAFAGCTLALRLSSYVPGMAGGRGWTALAAVFLGRKNPLIVVLSVFVFALAEFASTNLQNISFFSSIPSSILLSLPYLLALLLIIVIPQKKENGTY